MFEPRGIGREGLLDNPSFDRVIDPADRGRSSALATVARPKVDRVTSVYSDGNHLTPPSGGRISYAASANRGDGGLF